jgi:hypothetical protein
MKAAEAQRFLTALHGGLRGVVAFVVKDRDGRGHVTWAPAGTLPEAARTAPEDAHVFVSIATYREPRLYERSILAVPALWCDLDVPGGKGGGSGYGLDPLPLGVPPAEVERWRARARRALSRRRPAPSIVVHSGRGLHAYWTRPDPYNVLGIEDANAHLARELAELGADATVVDVVRQMRLPGTFNPKPSGGMARLLVAPKVERPVLSLLPETSTSRSRRAKPAA